MAITQNKTYQQEIKKEKDREYQYYATGKGRYTIGISQAIAEYKRERKPTTWLSDNGDAAEKMYAALDGNLDPGHSAEQEQERLHRLNLALRRLRRKIPETANVFLLICKYGKDRQRSIYELMKMHHCSFKAAEWRYFDHREKILKFFKVPVNIGRNAPKWCI